MAGLFTSHPTPYPLEDQPVALTKEHIVDSLCSQCGLSKKKPINLVESVLELLKSTLESAEDVLITGFGNFCVREKNERRGRNPQTGEKLMLSPRRVSGL